MKKRIFSDEERRQRSKGFSLQYYKENREKKLAYQNAYNQKNKELIKEKRKIKYDKEHPEPIERHRKSKEEIAEQRRGYRKRNREKINEYNKYYNRKNKEKISEYRKDYNQKNRKKIGECAKKYYWKDVEKIREKSGKKPRVLLTAEEKRQHRREYEIKNKEKINARRAKKRLEMGMIPRVKHEKRSPEEERKRKTEYELNRRRTNMRAKLRFVASKSILKKLHKRNSGKGGDSSFKYLPYTIDDLIRHLESLFESWMNWNNFGNKPGRWCIDHKIPDSSFNYKTMGDPEFQKSWALENLQPMEWLENCRKSDKILIDL